MRLSPVLGASGDPLNPIGPDEETAEQAVYRLQREVKRLRRGVDLLSEWQSVHALLPAELRGRCGSLNIQTLAFLESE